MKHLRELILIFFFLAVIQSIYSQIWPKYYFAGNNSGPWSVIESYDKGFIISGTYYYSTGVPKFGYILKTDINGNILWFKHFGSLNYKTSIYSAKQTTDGGYIFTGSKSSVDPSGDVFFAKTDPCLNLEWCKQYNSNYNQFDWGREVYEISGGYVALVEQFGTDIFNKRIWLFKMNENGDLIWEQSYAQKDSLINNEESYSFIVTYDQHYVITGDCYYPDSGSISPVHLRPYIIKVDSSGNSEWELPWSSISGVSFKGQSFQSIVDNNKKMYSSGRHIESSAIPPGDLPTMIETDSSGNEIAWHDIINNTWQAIGSTIDWFNDSTIAIGGGWIFTPGDTVHNGVFKIARNGTLLQMKHMFVNDYTFSDAITTSDNKLMLVAALYTNIWNTYAWKLNSNLEYDTIYSQPFVYDSLCPYPITSDTIPLDCEIVGLDEPLQNPETGRLKVFPNPAFNQLHIEIPDKLKSGKQNPMFTITTIWHQWRSASLEIYNLFGERLYSGPIRQDDRTLDLDVSAWPRGMYVVRLVYNGNTVASEKVLLE